MNSRIILYIISGLIGAIILPILLQSGYIFAIDQAINTGGWIPKIGANNYWIGWISQVFVYLSIPIWVLEKLLVFMTFTLPALGTYLYFKKFVETKSSSALFFALSFSIFNPMLYSRFLDGQINIYIFYALFPLFIYFTKHFFEYKTLKPALVAGIWSILMIFTTLHASYFIFFVFLIFGLSYRKNIFNKKYFLQYTLGFTVIFCLQLLWLIPLFTSPEEKVFSTVSQITSFDSNQQSAFGTIPSRLNPYREVLSMRGYWGDYQNRFVASNDWFDDNSVNDSIYFICFLIMLGLIYSYRNKTPDRFIFTGLGVLGFMLSLGVTNDTIFTPINAVLYEYLPYYAGFREPQKFVLLLIISYIYFGYFGVIAIGEFFKKYNIQKIVASSVLLFCIISPVLYNFNMLFGFRGQISVQEYPLEWDQARDYLTSQSCVDCEYNTLVFPWHGYMRISWTHKVVGVWITKYFGENILRGDTIEIGEVYSSSTRPESKVIEKYISSGGLFRATEKISIELMQEYISDIESLGIKNILLLKESDYLWYQNLLEAMVRKDLLKVALENDMITIYKIEK